MSRAAYATIFAIVAAFAIAAIVLRLVSATLHRAVSALETVSAENREALRARARRLINALTVLAYGIAGLASVSLALEQAGVSEAHFSARTTALWLLSHGINIVVIIVGAVAVVRAANLAIEHLQHRIGERRQETDLEWRRRATTLSGILTNLVTLAVGFIASLMLLRELSIDVLPILTGAGIAGLAIGFGAQNLVRDVISGFFLILEDQVRVGDSVRINGVGGIVEQIKLRTILLRDGEGAVQVFPNGTVTTLANLSKQFAFAVVDFRVAYNENIDRVMGTVREVGAAIERDPVLGPLVLAPVEVTGVESLADGAATIRVRLKTRPLNQGKIANELRRRLMTAFVGRGIRPYAG